MKASFLIKFIIVVSVFSLVFGPLAGNNLFIKRVQAQQAQEQGQQQSFGATTGKAVAAGIACFAGKYAQTYATGLLAEAAEWAFGTKRMGMFAYAVPEAAVSDPISESKQQINMAMDEASDCIRDVVAKIIIDWLVDQIIVWIQGGGEPKFVTNWESFVSDAFQAGVGTVINESNFRFLCSPFRTQVRLSLLPVKKFPQRIECTLDQVVENIEDFYNDFSKGGWIAYNEMWQPQNNYYGQILLFYDEAMMKGLAAKEAAQDEAAAGRGFLGVKRCVEYVSPDVTCGDAASREEYESCVANVKANPDKADCVKWQTNTPGFVVGEAAAEAITSDIKWAYNVKSWVAAIINAAINRVITEGVAYMKSSKEKPTGYGTAQYTGDFDPTQGGKAVKITGAQYWGAVQGEKAKADLPGIIEDYKKILADRQAILASKQASLFSVNSLITVLNDMKNKGCSEFSQTDLDAAQKAQSGLQSDISNLQSVIAEVSANLEEAESVGETIIQTGG